MPSFSRRLLLPIAAGVGLLGLSTAAIVTVANMASNQTTNGSQNQTIALPQGTTRLLPVTSQVVGGDLEVTGHLTADDGITTNGITTGGVTFTPIVSPPVAGQLYMKADNSLNYFNGTRNINLSAPAGSSTTTNITNDITNVTNTAVTQDIFNDNTVTNINTVSLNAGAGISITQASDGSYTVASTVDGANRSLSNLQNTALNTDLFPGTTNTLDIGSQTNTFRSGYYGTAIYSPLLDTATAGTLNIGTTNATGINLGANTTIAAGKSLTANGTALFKNNVNSASAFVVQDSAGAALLNADTTQGKLSVGTFVPTVISVITPEVVTANPATTNTYAAGYYPYSVTTRDFNGDGKPDLSVVSATDSIVSILMNTGTGTFPTKVSYATGSSPRSVTTADFNADGKPD